MPLRRLPSVAAVLAAVGASCLPADDRPEPASLLVTAEPSDATADGFTTSDGWAITLDAFVMALGDVRLDAPRDRADDACNAYSETHYEWLFDFAIAGREKVGLAYGLGTCAVSYRFRGPSEGAVLGAGATEAEAEAMRVEDSDAYSDSSRQTLVARGRARRGAETKTFAWSFRRSYRLDQCPRTTGDGYVSELLLRGGESHTLRVVVRGEELFRRGADDDAVLQFDLYADADLDHDGAVTLEELAEVDAPTDLPTGAEGGGGAGGGGGASSSEPITTLADLVYVALVPRVTRIADGGACQAEVRGGR